jgi:hypothetical protein
MPNRAVAVWVSWRSRRSLAAFQPGQHIAAIWSIRPGTAKSRPTCADGVTGQSTAQAQAGHLNRPRDPVDNKIRFRKPCALIARPF